MDCRTCQPTLLDLAYGELAPELASVVRAHVDGCDNCTASLNALQQGMEGADQLAWLEPPASLRANALAYAEQHARERAQAAVKASSRPRGPLAQRLFDFIGRLASGRQVAMATVMVLVVAVGVWVIPELQPLPEGQGVTVVSPDPEGEAAPSAGLAPAEPLDLQVDARSRRIRSREEIEAARATRAASGEPSASAGYASAERPAEAVAPAPSTVLPAEAEPGVAGVERTAKGGSAGSSRYDRAASGAQRDGTRARAKSEAQAFPDNELREDALGKLADSSGMRARAAEAPRPAAVPKSAAVDDLMESSAVRGAGAGDTAYGGEAKRKASNGVASSLERARALRAASGCAAAVPAYEQAVAEYSRSMPQSSVLGTALIELAECQWQIGRADSARATLKRAESVAPVAVRARALLDSEVDAEPAAQQAPAAAPSAPAQAAPSKD